MKLIKLISGLSIGKLAVFGLLLTLGYYLTYFDDGSALEAQIMAANAQVTAETSRRAEIQKTMKKEEEMRGNLLQLARNLEVVKSKIPLAFSDTEMSVLLNGAAAASGVGLLELSTVSVVQESQKIIDPSSVKPEDLIEEIKFNIILAGTYEEFLTFLDVLTKEDKILKVRNFVIERNSPDIDNDLIKFKGEVIGYKQSATAINQARGVK